MHVYGIQTRPSMQAQMLMYSCKLMQMDRGRLTLSMQHFGILCELLAFLHLPGEGNSDLTEVVEAIPNPAPLSEHQPQASSTRCRRCSLKALLDMGASVQKP